MARSPLRRRRNLDGIMPPIRRGTSCRPKSAPRHAPNFPVEIFCVTARRPAYTVSPGDAQSRRFAQRAFWERSNGRYAQRAVRKRRKWHIFFSTICSVVSVAVRAEVFPEKCRKRGRSDNGRSSLMASRQKTTGAHCSSSEENASRVRQQDLCTFRFHSTPHLPQHHSRQSIQTVGAQSSGSDSNVLVWLAFSSSRGLPRAAPPRASCCCAWIS